MRGFVGREDIEKIRFHLTRLEMALMPEGTDYAIDVTVAKVSLEAIGAHLDTVQAIVNA